MNETTAVPETAAVRERLLAYAGRHMSHANDRAYLSSGEADLMVLRAMRELCPVALPYRDQWDGEYTARGIAHDMPERPEVQAAWAQASGLVAGITQDEIAAAYDAYLAALPASGEG